MKLYAIKVGFYEELAGIFDNETKAKDIASKIDEAEVCELELNKLTSSAQEFYFHSFSIQMKKDGEVIFFDDCGYVTYAGWGEGYSIFEDYLDIDGIKALCKEDAIDRANYIRLKLLKRGEWGKDEK